MILCNHISIYLNTIFWSRWLQFEQKGNRYQIAHRYLDIAPKVMYAIVNLITDVAATKLPIKRLLSKDRIGILWVPNTHKIPILLRAYNRGEK